MIAVNISKKVPFKQIRYLKNNVICIFTRITNTYFWIRFLTKCINFNRNSIKKNMLKYVCLHLNIYDGLK